MLAYATLSSLGYTFFLAQRLRPVLPRGALVPFGAMAAMGVVQVLPHAVLSGSPLDCKVVLSSTP